LQQAVPLKHLKLRRAGDLVKRLSKRKTLKTERARKGENREAESQINENW
jgi:hypothetical protein